MIRCIGLSDGGLRCCQVLRKYVVKGRVRKAVTAWVSYSFRQSQSFKTVLVSSISEGIECFFSREHRLIMICVEIAPDQNAFNGWHRRSDYVMDVRQKLINSDLTFSNVLCGLGLFITASDKIALQVHRIDTDVLVTNLKPRERETSRRIDAVHRFPRLCPCCLCLVFG